MLLCHAHCTSTPSCTAHAKMYYTLPELPSREGFDGCFRAYDTLSDLPSEQTALSLLRRVAYVVGPIMCRREWTVPMLLELSGDDGRWGYAKVRTETKYFETSLGRTYTGAQAVQCDKIYLQLRTRSDPYTFLRTDVIVQTLLHELAHISTRGGHGMDFYWRNMKLLKELERDVKEDLVKVGAWSIPKRVAFPNEVKGLNRAFVALVSNSIFMGDKRQPKPFDNFGVAGGQVVQHCTHCKCGASRANEVRM
ncbi:hypothetical protein HBI56_231810 [Parastagonospora nodorum]|nr:hypothetical protein HBH53_239010 [Parastagonospora nodorum]KAH3957143.1 hypothetical protein HBH51_229320 [Parastagonospora nodorum]KAH3993655.1 hypothetical protein HBI10_200300 [Parastagonospora nodorum]KAH4012204.1 hypothetical protein HBI13_189850 [Parastagonospora nodorum]KAH4195338.1 hypothetical protein HBI95_197160 [Parastagonospora nodorum]